MEIKKYSCVKQVGNGNMGGVECYSNSNTIFFIDKYNLVSVGDFVQIEVDSGNNYRRIWVNGDLVAKDYANHNF